MEQNSDETTPANAEGTDNAAAEAAPVRRRASRRVSTATAAPAEAPAAPAETPAEPAEDTAQAAPAAEAEAPKKRATRSRKKAAEPEAAEAPAVEAPAAEAPAAESAPTTVPGAPAAETASAETAAAAEQAAAEAEAPKKRATRSRKKAAETAEATPAETAEAAQSEQAAAAGAEASAGEAAPAEQAASEPEAPKKRASRRNKAAETTAAASEESATTESRPESGATEAPQEAASGSPSEAAHGESQAGRRNRRGRAQKSENGDQPGENADASAKPAADEDGKQDSGKNRGKNGSKTGRDSGKNGDSGKSREAKEAQGDSRDDARPDSRGSENSPKSSRTRQRDRKRRGQDDLEPELTEDDVLLPVAGILDVLDNYAFVRTAGYLPGTNDVYVSLGQVKKYGLRKGDAVVGAIRQPRDGEGGGRQKYNAIVKVDSVNGRPLDDARTRSDFSELTPLYPETQLRLETGSDRVATRAVDLVAPIGRGQRSLIVSAPKSGKPELLREISEAVSENHPDAHLMVVLVDERPEEVTQLQRTVKGEIIASTFDRSPEDHTTIAELAIERAKRLVELGHDVVVVLDSLTALGRAYRQTALTAGRGQSSVPDSTVLQPAKKLFGAARNLENGGSLTIIATALEKTGVKADKRLLREFAGTANSELHLSRDLAEKHLQPAIDLRESGTDREDLLRTSEETSAVAALRRELLREGSSDALETLLKRLGDTASNAELLGRAPSARGLS